MSVEESNKTSGCAVTDGEPSSSNDDESAFLLGRILESSGLGDLFLFCFEKNVVAELLVVLW